MYRIIINRLHHSPIPMPYRSKYYRVKKKQSVPGLMDHTSSSGLKVQSASGLIWPQGRYVHGLKDMRLGSRICAWAQVSICSWAHTSICIGCTKYT